MHLETYFFLNFFGCIQHISMSQSEYKMSYILKQVKNFELWAPHYSVALVVKNPSTNAGDVRDCGLDPWIWRIPCGRKWQLTLVFLSRKLHGQRRLAYYSPWGCQESDTAEAI